MNKKTFISLGVGTAAVAALIIANAGANEREIQAFDEIKLVEEKIENNFADINDAERIEKSLLNELVLNNETEKNKRDELLEKINDRERKVLNLTSLIIDKENAIGSIKTINNSRFLNKETKMVGEKYIELLDERLEVLRMIENMYEEALKEEKELYLNILEINEEGLINSINTINEEYIEIEKNETKYNSKINELKVARKDYVTDFGYKES